MAFTVPHVVYKSADHAVMEKFGFEINRRHGNGDTVIFRRVFLLPEGSTEGGVGQLDGKRVMYGWGEEVGRWYGMPGKGLRDLALKEIVIMHNEKLSAPRPRVS